MLVALTKLSCNKQTNNIKPSRQDQLQQICTAASTLDIYQNRANTLLNLNGDMMYIQLLIAQHLCGAHAITHSCNCSSTRYACKQRS